MTKKTDSLAYCVRCGRPFLKWGRTLTCSPECSKKLEDHESRSYAKLTNKAFYARTLNDSNHQKVNVILGEFCSVCNNSKGRIHCHEIHGKKHVLDLYYVLTHPKDFKRLCHSCHAVVHWLSKLDDNQIKELINLCRKLKEAET